MAPVHPRILICRYAFMVSKTLSENSNDIQAFQFVNWAITFSLSLALARDFVLFIVLALVGLVMFIYVPYALHITYRDKHVGVQGFDHAGGEVAFVVVAGVGWLIACGVDILLTVLLGVCQDEEDYYLPTSTNQCGVGVALAVLTGLQTIIMILWLWMIVFIVYKSPNTLRSEAYRTSVNWLLRGASSPQRGPEITSMAEEAPRPVMRQGSGTVAASATAPSLQPSSYEGAIRPADVGPSSSAPSAQSPNRAANAQTQWEDKDDASSDSRINSIHGVD
ncbi:hypothetical protein BD324DRAFT_615754 [Kockovaella imperatae]|uniref:Uncharacterized protein n=1 Tax=Kockovaella imperatae TaxID=4999 RepID=A0A1Y1UPK0_9TREE|nr:hypothetical protein BD324DRAFT_615754 [Kockovaella imperatae]ORX39978.1 hypothetical protein BD324DRAFT_615754 [Kockovaella imperatae]